MMRERERQRYGRIYDVNRYVGFRVGTANFGVSRDRASQCFTGMWGILWETIVHIQTLCEGYLCFDKLSK